MNDTTNTTSAADAMQSARHTPSPWTAHGNIVNSYAAQPTVNVARTAGLCNEEAAANARLVAAAPDLLAVAQMVQWRCPINPEPNVCHTITLTADEIADLREVIAAATPEAR